MERPSNMMERPSNMMVKMPFNPYKYWIPYSFLFYQRGNALKRAGVAKPPRTFLVGATLGAVCPPDPPQHDGEESEPAAGRTPFPLHHARKVPACQGGGKIFCGIAGAKPRE